MKPDIASLLPQSDFSRRQFIGASLAVDFALAMRLSGWVIIGLLAFSKLVMAAPTGEDTASTTPLRGKFPRVDHVVVVIEENKSFDQIIGNPGAPYINQLANNGALFIQSYAITHPSQPNYLALFSGSTQGSTDDRCPLSLQGDNLASELQRKGLTFATYSESLPAIGYTGCKHEHYQRKHNPAANWQGDNVTADMNLPFSMFPSDYSKLPTISLVVPNQLNDMHDGEAENAIVQGDKWLRDHLDSYVQWASRHHGLLILTWDEDDGSSSNHITTVLVGPMVRRGRYDLRIDHYSVLRTLTDLYRLRPLGNSSNATPILGVWTTPR